MSARRYSPWGNEDISQGATAPDAAPVSGVPPAEAGAVVDCSFRAHGDRPSGPACACASQKCDGLPSEPRPAAGTVVLPDDIATLLAVVCAHDRVAPAGFVTRAVCERADAIGLPAVLDGLDAKRGGTE